MTDDLEERRHMGDERHALPKVRTTKPQSRASKAATMIVAYGFVGLSAALIFSLGFWGLYGIWSAIAG